MARSDDPAPPRDSSPHLPAVLSDVSVLGRGTSVIAARLGGLSGDVDASHAELVEVVWEDPALDRLDISGALLTDVSIREPRIAVMNGREGRWRDVEIAGGRIGSIDLLRAELDGVTFRDVRVDYLGLPSARLSHVRFVSCSFGTIDLPEARCDRVSFEGCRADEVDTRGLRAAHLDLRGVEVLAFTDSTSLRGATLSSRQSETHSAAFAAALGIRIRD